jgi:hypothetical protein
MEIEEIIKKPEHFRCRLLGRLKSDAESFISHGSRLWGGTPVEHADFIENIYNSFNKNITWFNRQDLIEILTQLRKGTIK